MVDGTEEHTVSLKDFINEEVVSKLNGKLSTS